MAEWDIWGGPAPEVDGLDEFRDALATRGIEVRQTFHPSVELDDGTLTEGHWVVTAYKRTRLADGRVWLAQTDVSNEYVGMAFHGADLLADLLEKDLPPDA